MLLAHQMYVAWLPIPGVIVSMVDLQDTCTLLVTDSTDKAIFAFIGSQEVVG